MHPSVAEWVPRVLTPKVVKGKRVLEVGSYNVNGSVRPSIEPHAKKYIGVDATAGPSVDEVVDAADLVKTFGAGSFDVVVSCEMLEHAEEWRKALHQMAAVTSDWLVVTTRSEGMPYHPYPDDFWRFRVDQIVAAVEALRFDVVTVEADPYPGHPGVFAAARKPKGWKRPRLSVLDAVKPSEVKP